MVRIVLIFLVFALVQPALAIWPLDWEVRVSAETLILPGSVTSQEIAAGAITTAVIEDGSITSAKLSSEVSLGYWQKTGTKIYYNSGEVGIGESTDHTGDQQLYVKLNDVGWDVSSDNRVLVLENTGINRLALMSTSTGQGQIEFIDNNTLSPAGYLNYNHNTDTIALGFNTSPAASFGSAYYNYSIGSGAGTYNLQYNPTTSLVTYLVSGSKYKENIEPWEPDLSKFKDIECKEYNYKSEYGGCKSYGPIAEELYKVYPEMVVLDPDKNPDALCYFRILFLAVKKIQELEARIQELEK